MNFRQFIKIIEAHGFEIVPKNSGGSHHKYTAYIGGIRRVVTVSHHQLSNDIRPKTLASMIRQSGLSKKIFR